MKHETYQREIQKQWTKYKYKTSTNCITSFTCFLWVKSKSEGFFRMMMMIVFRSVPRCFPPLGFSAAVISFPLGADQKPLRWWSGGLSFFQWFQSYNCHDIDDDHKRCSNWQKDTEKIIFMNILIMILVFPWNKDICFSISINLPKCPKSNFTTFKKGVCLF